MDERFLNAYFDPSRVKFLGRFVWPFCLKYRVRLMALNSPLVTGHRGITPVDLIVAIQVCAEEPVGYIGWLDKWRILRLNSQPAKFEAILQRFSDYILVGHWPKFWEKTAKQSGGNGGGVPWPLSVVCNLIANGIAEKRAWEMPECQAIWMNAAFAICKGADISILTSEEEKIMDEVREARKAAEAVANPAKVETPTDPDTIPEPLTPPNENG